MPELDSSASAFLGPVYHSAANQQRLSFLVSQTVQKASQSMETSAPNTIMADGIKGLGSSLASQTEVGETSPPG